jgi:hypothetical protein
MSSEAIAPRSMSRKGLLAGAGAGIGAVAAQAALGPAAARAADGQPVLLGQTNSEASTTRIENGSTGPGAALYVAAGGSTNIDPLSYGNASGLVGDCAVGPGVLGLGSPGVRAAGKGGPGIIAQTLDADQPAIVAIGSSASGVTGSSDAQDDSAAGIFGGSGQGTGSVAVMGVSSNGLGVKGRSDNGVGVRGESAPGTGVEAVTSTGTGLSASSDAGGVALRVRGRAVFNRSGRATVPPGATSVTVTGVPLTASSLVLATIQANRPNTNVRAAVPNPGASSFTIFLTAAPNAATPVGWFVVN